MGKMVKGPWPDLTYSVDEVHNLTQEYWSANAKMRKYITHVRRFFMKEKTIWPDQCEHIIEMLRTLSGSVLEFGEFLDKSEKLPSAICSIRYPLLMVLHRIDAQTRELGLLLASFSSNSWIPSQQSLLQLEEIRQSLESLSQSWKEAQRDVKLFLDQMESIEEAV